MTVGEYTHPTPLKLCQKYNVYANITSVEFTTYNKMVVLNGENLYCFD